MHDGVRLYGTAFKKAFTKVIVEEELTLQGHIFW
jgi:hypothetical protein